MPSLHTRSLVPFLLLVLAPSLATGQEANPPELPPDGTPYVYLNTQQIIQAAPGASEAQQKWQQELEQYRSEVKTLRAELDSLQQAYQQQEGMLSQQARQRKQQEIVDKQRKLQTRVQELEQKAAQRRQQLLQPILEDVRAVIEDIRAERGYRMVFDASAGALLTADPELDITQHVLERLQTQSQDGGAGGTGGGPDDLRRPR